MKIINKLFKKKSTQQGFTLLELMVVVALIGMVSAAGFPSLMLVLNEQKLTTQANDLIASLNLARSTSIKRREVVTIRKGSNWNDGWEIFIDENGDGDKDLPGDTLLKAYPGIKAGSGTIASSNFADFISYSPNGRAKDNNSVQGDFTFCPPSGVDSSRKIDIAGSGRMRTEKGNYAANCP